MSDFYVRPDGVEEVTWMRPHRELVASLPLTDEQTQAVNAALDAVYRTTIEERSEEHRTEHELLLTLLNALDPGGIEVEP